MKKWVACLVALLMTATMMMPFASADVLSDIQAKGTLVVGANVGFPPYEFYYADPETGEETLCGFDMALAQAIADEIGVEFVLADQTFAGLITALRAGDIDIIASGMAARPDRKEVIDFSNPYFVGEQVVLVRTEDVDTLTTVESLTGKNVGAQMGSMQATFLEEQFSNATPMLMENVQLLMMDLVQGQLDAVLITNLVAKAYINRYEGKLAISQVPVVFSQADGVSVGVAKGDNASFLEVINKVIAQVKEDGTFDEWVEEAAALHGTLLD